MTIWNGVQTKMSNSTILTDAIKELEQVSDIEALRHRRAYYTEQKMKFTMLERKCVLRIKTVLYEMEKK